MTALTHLRAMHIHGIDAEKFLQAQLSCDVSSISNTAVMAAVCVANGRVAALGWLARASDSADFIWYLTTSDAAIAFATLSKYKLRAKVQLQLLDDTIYPNSAGRCAASLPDQRSLSLGAANAADIDVRAFQYADLLQRYPVAGGGERFLPQMLALERLGGLSLKKGCFPGQEVISRLHYKGELKRRLHHFRLSLTVELSAASYAINDGRDKLEIVQQIGTDFLAVAPIAASEFRLDEFPECAIELIA